MAEMQKEKYTFPDEAEDVKNEDQDGNDFEVEIEDDTPEADRGKKPADPELVKELETDELEEYSKEVKSKIKKYKKVFHDERRAKEAAERERQEAISVAQKLYNEVKELKNKVHSTEEVAVDSFKTSAERELDMAKREYKEAYDSGDSDKLVEAQERMTSARMKLEKADNAFDNIKNRKALQDDRNEVQIPQQQYQQPVRDPKAAKWQERNSWFGQDDEMTSLALGLHEKLVKENGVGYATTDEYYKRIDKTMRKRFPENFEDDDDNEIEAPSVKTATRKPSTVVAPAARSTSSKKVRLTTSQQAIARKLGLSPEQYVKELLKMEA
jgi:hypothetical protein